MLTFYFRNLLVIIGVFLCSMNAIHAQSSLDKWDEHILKELEYTRTPMQTSIFRSMSRVNTYVNAAVPIGMFALGAINNNKEMRQNAAYIAGSVISTTLVNALVKVIVKRPRPFRISINLVPVYMPGGYSFPSGHSSSAFSAFVGMSRAYPKWYVIAPSMLWAAGIGYSRMYLGVHNTSDVVTGAALGTLSSFLWVR